MSGSKGTSPLPKSGRGVNPPAASGSSVNPPPALGSTVKPGESSGRSSNPDPRSSTGTRPDPLSGIGVSPGVDWGRDEELVRNRSRFGVPELVGAPPHAGLGFRPGSQTRLYSGGIGLSFPQRKPACGIARGTWDRRSRWSLSPVGPGGVPACRLRLPPLAALAWVRARLPTSSWVEARVGGRAPAPLPGSARPLHSWDRFLSSQPPLPTSARACRIRSTETRSYRLPAGFPRDVRPVSRVLPTGPRPSGVGPPMNGPEYPSPCRTAGTCLSCRPCCPACASSAGNLGSEIPQASGLLIQSVVARGVSFQLADAAYVQFAILLPLPISQAGSLRHD